MDCRGAILDFDKAIGLNPNDNESFVGRGKSITGIIFSKSCGSSKTLESMMIALFSMQKSTDKF